MYSCRYLRLMVALLLAPGSHIINVGANDTTIADSVLQMDEIVVSAARHDRPFSLLPLNVGVVRPDLIKSIPAISIDDALQLTSGVNQDRKYGIFGGSGNTVNLLGITGGEQGRVLVLEDGIPINLADNGEVNWNRFDIADYRQIEIIKGPASSLYGSNAMGGIINLVSEKPVRPLQFRALLSVGNYSTAKVSTAFMGLTGNFNWSAKLMYHRSDGYIMPPDSLRDTTDVPTFLNEASVRLKAAYRLNRTTSLEAAYSYYTDKHGYGIKILDEQGGFTQHPVHTGRIGLRFDDAAWFGSMNVFIQQENYYKLIERLRDTLYSAIDVYSERIDAGFLSYFGRRLGSLVLSSGIDLRTGSTSASDIYRTSSDVVSNRGKVYQASASLHAESDLIAEYVKAGGSVHYTRIALTGAQFSVSDPTSETDYMRSFEQAFNDTVWNSVSPSLFLIYSPSARLKLMMMYAHGFRSPTIDDLTRSGMISIGFKEANPSLKPEKIDQYQLAFRVQGLPRLFLSGAISYSQGNDYIYYTETGETLFGGRRKVYRRSNVNKVEVASAELNLEWKPYKWITVHAASYASRSVILGNATLQGKTLAYSPGFMQSLGLITENRILHASAIVVYKGEQFINDENTATIPANAIVNLKLTRIFAGHYKVSFTVQNLFNKTFLTDGYNLSLGRFLNAGIELLF